MPPDFLLVCCTLAALTDGVCFVHGGSSSFSCKSAVAWELGLFKRLGLAVKVRSVIGGRSLLIDAELPVASDGL